MATFKINLPLIVFLWINIAFARCEFVNVEHRIVGGEITTIGKYPFAVSKITYNNLNFCGKEL